MEQAYLIQLGADFAATDEGRQYFTKAEAEHLYEQLHKSLQHVMQNGSKEECDDAWLIVCNFRVLPYAVH